MTDPQQPGSLHIRLLTSRDVDTAADVLARSLLVEPGYVAILPDEAMRLRMLSVFFRGTIAQSIRHQAAWGAFDGGVLLGVAEWVPPLGPGRETMDRLRMAPTYIRMLTIRFRPTLGLWAEDRAAVAYFPDEPFWYLLGLGVSPLAQGRGVGSALIQPGLEAAANAGLPAYLETGTERNVRFYTRFGFKVVEPAARLVQNGPTHWTMIRR
ncbi:MAG TPA: GNAT family N-acetyltransferase [Thermomicrobiales bacterium]|nr:GNAT family N-acetyltransferase [Thermomicrobiales bacterium]